MMDTGVQPCGADWREFCLWSCQGHAAWRRRVAKTVRERTTSQKQTFNSLAM